MSPADVFFTEKHKQDILGTFFKGSLINVDWRVEGNAIIDKQLVIGGRAGPEVCVTNLIHEMAHFVEIDEPRMMLYGWGLKVPEVYILGRRCLEPVTMQGTMRELRVCALQRNVEQSFGIVRSIEDTVRSLVHLPDFCYVKRASSDRYNWDDAASYDVTRLNYVAATVERFAR